MIREKEYFLIRLIKITDAFFILLSFVASYFVTLYIRKAVGVLFWENFESFFQKYFLLGIIAVPVWISAMSFYGIYRNFRTKAFSETLWKLIQSGGLTVISLGSITFLFKMQIASRSYIAVFILTAIFLLSVERYFFLKILQIIWEKGYNQINLLIVGTGKRAQHFIGVIKDHADWGFQIIGLIDDDPKLLGKEILDYPIIGRIKDIPKVLRHAVIDRVIFIVPRMWLNRIEEAIFHCEREGIPTAVSVDLFKPKLAQLQLSNMAGIPLIIYQTSVAKEWQLFLKRTVDILIAFFAIVLLLPVFLFSLIGIKLTSKGPVFYSQTRCGLNGRKFTLYKFRSMFEGADMRKKELQRQNEMNGPVFKMRRDPRVTPFGKFMRKFSIDELPQLFNVLKGDMSLVGPRPPLPAEVTMYQSWQRRRLSMKPGLTCIWQVSGRSKIDFDRWMEMDLEYIDQFSLWLDFRILFRTFFVVVTVYGAN